MGGGTAFARLRCNVATSASAPCSSVPYPWVRPAVVPAKPDCEVMRWSIAALDAGLASGAKPVEPNWTDGLSCPLATVKRAVMPGASSWTSCAGSTTPRSGFCW